MSMRSISMNRRVIKKCVVALNAMAMLVGLVPLSAASDIASGLSLNFDAQDVVSGVDSATWKSTTADSSQDFGFGGDVSLQSVSTGLSGISKAYRFTGGSGDKDNATWNGLFGEGVATSWEFWIKPADTGDFAQTIYESGGSGTGFAIWYAPGTASDGSGTINFTLDGGSGSQVETVSAVIDTTEFRQVTLVYEKDASGSIDFMAIYVDGVMVDDNLSVTTSDDASNDNDNTDISDYCGGDGTGLGDTNNGLANDVPSDGEFEGDISVFRVWGSKALSALEIQDNYNELAGPDTTPPEISALSPTNNATGVYIGIEQLVATFTKDIAIITSGTISVTNLGSATHMDITLPDDQVIVDGSVLTINLTNTLEFGTGYAVRISDDAIEDLADTPNTFGGITNDTTWSFTTVAYDGAAPVITSTIPVDDATGVSRATSLAAIFDKNIIIGSGDITISNVTDATLLTTIAATNATQVWIEGNMLVVVPGIVLPGEKECAVQIDSGAVKNLSDVGFAGISDNTTWSFTTALNTAYTWTQTSGGILSWDTAANWDTFPSVPNPGAGDTVDFSTVDIASTTLTLEADRTAEVWKFGDTGNGHDWTVNSGNTMILAGTTPTVDVVNRTTTLDNVLDGTNGLIKAGSGDLTLGGANTYTGDTIINGGDLYVGYRYGPSGTLGNGAYAGNIYIAGGSKLKVWGNVNQTFSGDISGDGDLTKAFNGTLTLSGNNTYSGQTTISPQTTAGSTLSVSSFNSINGGVPLLASSSLGCPTNEANGTIVVGDTGKQATCTLKYTGTGETTDRIINLRFNGSCKQIIDTSGSGLLKFTSPFTVGGRMDQYLILRGTGSGEIAGGLPQLPAQGVRKESSGTWTFSGVNSYTGPTSVTGGTLVLAHGECLSDTAGLTINGGILQLNTGVREKVDSLVLGSTTMPSGSSYGSSSSKAVNKDDTYFSGTGILYVGMDIPPLPPSGTLIMIK